MNFFKFCISCFLLSFSVFAEESKKNILIHKNIEKENSINEKLFCEGLANVADNKLDLKNFVSSDVLSFLKATIGKDVFDKYQKLIFELEKLKLENEYKIVKSDFEQFDIIEKRKLDIGALKYEYERCSYEVDLLKLQVAKQFEEFKLAELSRIKKIEEYKNTCEEIAAKQRMLSLQKECEHRIVIKDSDKYLLNPILKNGNIRISDRKVYLNGIIDSCNARYVADMINYYNNKDDKFPIFVVINKCLGGCGNAGGQIINAISSSRAPVYVVLTGEAFSMAAIIIALSDRSFVLKDAIITHHLGWTKVFSAINLRNAKDIVASLEEFTRRLTGRVATKMGISLEEFIKRMYEKNTDGDWQEFGDSAVKLKWATGLINGVEDVAIDEKPVFYNYINRKGLHYCGEKNSLGEDLTISVSDDKK